MVSQPSFQWDLDSLCTKRAKDAEKGLRNLQNSLLDGHRLQVARSRSVGTSPVVARLVVSCFFLLFLSFLSILSHFSLFSLNFSLYSLSIFSLCIQNFHEMSVWIFWLLICSRYKLCTTVIYNLLFPLPLSLSLPFRNEVFPSLSVYVSFS